MKIKSEQKKGKNLMICYRGENFDIPLSCYFLNIIGKSMMRQDARVFLSRCYDNVHLGFEKYSEQQDYKKKHPDYINPFSEKHWLEDYDEEELRLALRVVPLSVLRGKAFREYHDMSVGYLSDEEILKRCFLVSSPVFSVNGQVSLENGEIIFRDKAYLSKEGMSELNDIFGVQKVSDTSQDGYDLSYNICNFTRFKINEGALFKVFLKGHGKGVGKDTHDVDFDAKIQNGHFTLVPCL